MPFNDTLQLQPAVGYFTSGNGMYDDTTFATEEQWDALRTEFLF